MLANQRSLLEIAQKHGRSEELGHVRPFTLAIELTAKYPDRTKR